MASQIPSTWGQMRCVYAKNSYGWYGNLNNIVYPYGIYPSSPSSVLFRLPLIARYIFQSQPIAEIGFRETYASTSFFFGNSPSVGGIIPDKEWAYIKGKTVTTGGGTTTTFAITDDAQFNYFGQTIEGEEIGFSVESIEGFTAF